MGRKNKRKKQHIRPLRVKQLLGHDGRAAFQTGGKRMNRYKNIDMGLAKPQNTDYKPKRGEIWFAALEVRYGTSVQGGKRPVLIVSNDISNRHARTINVAPMTSKIKRLDIPSHVIIRAYDCQRSGNFGDSLVLMEQLTTIDKCDLLECVGRVTNPGVLEQVTKAMQSQLGMGCY